MNDRRRLALQRFNWIGGLVMLAVYVLLNFTAPEMDVIVKLLIALAAAVNVSHAFPLESEHCARLRPRRDFV